MVSAASFTIGANMTSIKGMVSETFPSEQPAEETAPVVVKEQPVNVVTVRGRGAMKYTVVREDIDCWTAKVVGANGVNVKRQCRVDGVKTDLAGYSVHDTSIAYCYESRDGGYSWEESWPEHWACKAIYKLGAS